MQIPSRSENLYSRYLDDYREHGDSQLLSPLSVQVEYTRLNTDRGGRPRLQVAEERKADLARLYTLLARVQALDAMRVAFKEHIKKTGLSLVLDEEKARLSRIVRT